MKPSELAGMILVGAVGFYLFSLYKQSSDVVEACARYSPGVEIGDTAAIEDEYSLRVMGPYSVDDSPGVQEIILCASLTMCDEACRIQYSHGRVTKSWERSL